MNRDEAASSTEKYLKQRFRYRVAGCVILALLIASVISAHSPDDWATFDHHSFPLTGQIKLLGITAVDQDWLRDQTAGQDVTLLLQSPQTRDASGRLLAFAFLGDQNLSVEAVRQGMARADRREKSLFDGVIRPAEAEARKKMRGMWGKRGS